MAAIVWVETPLLDTGTPGTTPDADSDIDNAFDAAAYRNIWITADTTGGTNPSLTMTVWLWNSSRFVKTGGVYNLEPGVANLVRLDGGGLVAFEIVVNGGPSAWALNVGGQR